jgi:hypothetical protein
VSSATCGKSRSVPGIFAGAVLNKYTSKQGPACVMNVNKSSFWVLGDQELVGEHLLSWWRGRPAVT